MSARLFSFMGGDAGLWRVAAMNAMVGESLPAASRLAIASGAEISPGLHAAWVLRGITSNERYVVREERSQISAKLLGLGRIRIADRQRDLHRVAVPLPKRVAD